MRSSRRRLHSDLYQSDGNDTYSQLYPVVPPTAEKSFEHQHTVFLCQPDPTDDSAETASEYRLIEQCDAAEPVATAGASIASHSPKPNDQPPTIIVASFYSRSARFRLKPSRYEH